MDEFACHGHSVYVTCSIEKRFGIKTNLSESNGIKVLRVTTGNITSNPNYFAKGIALLQLQSLFIGAINQNFRNIAFDLIIYSTPPIQYNRIIKFLKKYTNARTYLLLKDIFPQNAIDLGLLKKWNPVYWYFRKKEIETYKLSDNIGCMSPANVNYVLNNNSYLFRSKIEVCPNSLKNRGKLGESDRSAIRSKIRRAYSIKDKDLLLVYGGNLGISQGLFFLLEIFKAYRNSQTIKFLIVGEGTWYNHIAIAISEGNYQNVILHKRILPQDFKEILIASDIGLIFLNPKFTIPNFPSRIISYLEVGLPVIACTDLACDVGDIIEEADCGIKVISGDIKRFEEAIQNITTNPGILREKSIKARELFEKSYTTEKAYTIIMKK
jgi:glycosyltransferase involved in cell wall biosynthesis